jgi:16S rRNA (guanine527-N7)-methyltransferase
VTSREFRERLIRRARRAKLTIAPETTEALEAYFALLARWNEKINLTALPLRTPTDETFDRLLIEPLAAARSVANEPEIWVDLGSGGGSPAIPIKVTRPKLKLTMVEAKVRKAAFLREAVRTLNLGEAAVENVRIETLATNPDRRRSASLVTVRAVKADAALFSHAAELLTPRGRLFLFRPTNSPISARGFEHVETVQLTEAPRAFLAILRHVFHVEQSH